MDFNLTEEFLKAIPELIIAALGLLAAWFVGIRISTHWEIRRKERELDLEAAETFYATYGEFFAVWKLWHAPPHHDGGEHTVTVNVDEDRLKLLQRASDAEGKVEALLVKLAVERRFEEGDAKTLASFRQGFQCLRESIERNETLRTYHSKKDDEWKASTDTRGRGAAYTAFKKLAADVAWIVCSRESDPMKASTQACHDLHAATDPTPRKTWWLESVPSPSLRRTWYRPTTWGTPGGASSDAGVRDTPSEST